MPTDAPALAAAVASRRILRLALGTSASLALSQAAGWELSFLAPVLTLVLLALPLPAPRLKLLIVLWLALTGPALAGSILLLPFFAHLHSVGVVLVTLALFFSFYVTARGAPAAVGTLLTLGITLNVAIGSVNIDALYDVLTGVAKSATFGLAFVRLAHALLPDPPRRDGPAARRPPAPERPPPSVARLMALRSTLVVLPVAIVFLFSSASASYIVVMVKVASMGQQAEAEQSRSIGWSLIESTFWGGVGAIAGWQLLSIWPSLTFYTLLVAVAALLYGRGIFTGTGMHPRGSMWSYAFLTMILLLAPAVQDSIGGSAAGAAFWSRLFLVGVAAVYGSAAVAVFDAFFARSRPMRDGPKTPERSSAA